jgi:hypothetical protein
MVDGSRQAASIDPAEARRMVRCGVDMIGFDQLHPFDPRLDALVWSWAPNEPATTASGLCAHAGPDGRFRSGDCGVSRPFACVSALGVWSVAGPAGPWTDGSAACVAAGASFSLPKSGFEDELLKAAAPGGDVWLDYRVLGTTWTAEAAG